MLFPAPQAKCKALVTANIGDSVTETKITPTALDQEQEAWESPVDEWDVGGGMADITRWQKTNVIQNAKYALFEKIQIL